MPRFQQGFVQNRQSGDIRQRKYRRQRRNKSGRIHVALKLHRYALLALMAGALAGGKAQAQNWPEKPITFVVPFAAGGGTDAFARPLAAQLDNQLGTRVLIETGQARAAPWVHLRRRRPLLTVTLSSSAQRITPSLRRSTPTSTTIFRRISSRWR